MHRDDLDVTEAVALEMRAKEALDKLRREVRDEAEVELRARDSR